MKLTGFKSKNLFLKFNITQTALSSRSLAGAVSSGDKHHDDDPHRFFDKDMEYIRKYAPIERKYKPPPFMGHTGFGQPDCEVFIDRAPTDYPDGPEKYYETVYYREGFRGAFNKKDYYMNKYIYSGVFWGFWLWYAFYYGMNTILVQVNTMSASCSKSSENETLRRNLLDQLDRVMRQLSDLEEYKKDLSAEEYDSMKDETKQQLNEFSASLSKLTSGDITLVDELSAVKLAVQAAISEAFKTPEVIRLFANKQPAQLRMKLDELERDRKINRIQDEILYKERKVEILLALKKLNDQLSNEEEKELENYRSQNKNLRNFEKASCEIIMSSTIPIMSSNESMPLQVI